MLTTKTTGTVTHNGRLDLQYLRDMNPDYVNPLEEALQEVEGPFSDLVFSTVSLNPEPTKRIKKFKPLRIVGKDDDTSSSEEPQEGMNT